MLFLSGRRRRLNGNRTKAQLIESGARNEGFAERGAWLVVLGLLIEIGLAFVFPSGRSFIERSAPVVATALIAIGVFLEIHFGRKALSDAAEVQSFSDKEVASANERASKANLETERLRAEFGWRVLSAEQAAILSDSLNGTFGGVNIRYIAGDIEAHTYSRQIMDIFLRASWRAALASLVLQKDPIMELRAPVEEGDSADAARILRTALSNAGIAFTTDPMPAHVLISGQEVNVGAARTHLYVGPKAMPGNILARESNI